MDDQLGEGQLAVDDAAVGLQLDRGRCQRHPDTSDAVILEPVQDVHLDILGDADQACGRTGEDDLLGDRVGLQRGESGLEVALAELDPELRMAEGVVGLDLDGGLQRDTLGVVDQAAELPAESREVGGRVSRDHARVSPHQIGLEKQPDLRLIRNDRGVRINSHWIVPP